VNAAASATLPSAGIGRALAFAGFMLVGGAATLGGVLFSNGNLVIAVAPMIVLGGVAAIWFAPLRIPLIATIFLSLALDSKNEGPWNSPLEPLGSLLANNLNQSLPVPALTLPGVVAIWILLLLIHVHRVMWGIRTDSAARIGTPRTLYLSMIGSFLFVAALCGLGAMKGGNVQMAKLQVQTFVLLLLVAYLCSKSLRGIRDYRILGGLVVAAACIKSMIALYVVNTVEAPSEMANGKLSYATTHGDSLLFAIACVLLIVRFAERPVARNGLMCLGVLPLLLAGMVANNRRLVWAQFAAGLLVFWIMSRPSKVKRLVVRTMIAAIPLFIAYVAVGWNSQAKIFAPVQTFRSMGDGEVDASTLYRDLENYNLVETIKASPFIGTGFGHPFAEVVTLPDISFFKEYRYLPHNSILGLWAFCGPLGFFGLTVGLVVPVYLAARSYRAARSPDQRVAAYMVIATIVIYMIHCWGDIGFTERRSMVLVGPALAMAGQLAIATGAWLPRPRRARFEIEASHYEAA
jgi:O-antigen ligase